MPSKRRFLLHWNSRTYHSPKSAFEALSGAFKWSTAPKGSSAFIEAIFSKLSGSDYQSCFSIVRDKTRRRKSRRPFFLMLKRLEDSMSRRRKKKAMSTAEALRYIRAAAPSTLPRNAYESMLTSQPFTFQNLGQLGATAPSPPPPPSSPATNQVLYSWSTTTAPSMVPPSYEIRHDAQGYISFVRRSSDAPQQDASQQNPTCWE